jgi:hypothetical protein
MRMTVRVSDQAPEITVIVVRERPLRKERRSSTLNNYTAASRNSPAFRMNGQAGASSCGALETSRAVDGEASTS